MRDRMVPRSSRRAFFGAAVSALALASLCPLAARAGDADDQAEWPQSYETSPQMSVDRETTPILSAATVDATQAAIQNYQDIAGRGGWSTVPGPRTQDRLEGAAGAGAARPAGRDRRSRPDRGLGRGLRFLRRGGGQALPGPPRSQPDRAGRLGDLAELNVSAEARVEQLETNIVRLSSFSGDLGQRFVGSTFPPPRSRPSRAASSIPITPPASARSTGSRRSCRPRPPRSISTRSGPCRRR